MKNTIYILLPLLIGCTSVRQLDYFVKGVEEPQICLNGTWEVNTEPGGEIRNGTEPGNEWKEIQVPGECMMQGFAIRHDRPFYYRKNFTIPGDFAGKIVKLRFDGVYSYAKVWIDGNYIRDHSGGFTRWECDISPFVKPGETCNLIMEVTDRADEISYASGYAKHPIGGILRDVYLMAYPPNYPDKIFISTYLDGNYKNAQLEVSGKTIEEGENYKIKLELYDKDNKKVYLDNSYYILSDSSSFKIVNEVVDPVKWDAEHPELYRLKVMLSDNKNIIWYRIFKIGFREIEIIGNKLLVNGQQVKLRGACRHDIHPLLGRVSVPDYELQDVKLAKEANINFIRTSHYPPTDNFLSLCDEYGIYVEDESAVCFVGSHRTAQYYPGSSENSENYTEQYLSQMEEIVQNHRNHPSVIIWSLGNESSFGSNIRKSYEWVKANDPSRPVIFSYPGLVPDSIKSYDLLSMHYPGLNGNLDQFGKVTYNFEYRDMPVIFDEWAHVPCYNNFTVREDPNIRDFWGISLDSMWYYLFNADAGTGGAIWGMLDETFMLPDTMAGFGEWWGVVDKNNIPSGYEGTTVGYGEWGIVDTWRRKKPEFWNTKKAYSPVRILNTTVTNFIPGEPVSVPILNRFDHTDFNELKIILTYKNRETRLNPFNLKPHARGSLSFKMVEWESDKPVLISFYDKNNNMVDTYELKNSSGPHAKINSGKNQKIDLKEEGLLLIASLENNTRIFFDKSSGLITRVQISDENINLSGPYLNLRTKGKVRTYTYNEINEYNQNWTLENFDFRKTDSCVIVSIEGRYTGISSVRFDVTIKPGMIINCRYHLGNVPKEYIREIGIKWVLDDVYDSLSWDRVSYWNTYPDGHLSATKGSAALYSNVIKKYRKKPTKDWVYDTKSFYYDEIQDELPGSQLTNIARSTKENIKEYNLINEGYKMISVISNGNINCRIAKKGTNMSLFVNNYIDYVDLNWGNFQRNILLEDNFTAELTMRIGPDL